MKTRPAAVAVSADLLVWRVLALFALLAALLAVQPARAQENAPIPVAPVASETDVIDRRISELREQILSRVDGVGVAADLYDLVEVARFGGPLERVADTLYRVAGTGRADPEVRALARQLLAEVEFLRGRRPRALAQLAAIGTIDEAAIVGPFDDENKGGFDVAYGPELDSSLDAVHDGLRGEVSWRVVPELGRAGRLSLGEAIRPSHESLAYVLVGIEARRPGAARLYLGTPGATKAWFNGRPILSEPSYHRAAFDQYSVPVYLQRGKNHLLIKVAAGNDGPFALFARLVGSDGRRIPGLRFFAPTEGSYRKPDPIPAGRRLVAERPLLSELRRQATSAAGRYDYARVLGERHPHDADDKMHERAAADAAHAHAGSVDAQLWAARMHDDVNERREFLERAIVAERPGEARAHAALATFWLGEGDAMRALSILEPRLERAPGDWPARLVLAHVYDALGQRARARRLVESQLNRFSDQPAVVQALARRQRADGELQAAIARLRVVLGLRPGDGSAASELASMLVLRGDVDEAERVLASSARLRPLDLESTISRADRLAANGRWKEAEALFSEAAIIAPDEGEVFAAKGRALLRSGKRQEALEALELASRLRPQDAQLASLRRSLEPGSSAFARPWLRDVDQLAREAEGKWEGEDAVRLGELRAVKVLPSGQSSQTVQRIVQVRTPRGVERYRQFTVRHAPGREQLRIERARVRKPDGTFVDAHTEHDRSMNEPWSGLYYDARAMVIGFPSLEPGDTVELIYTVDDVARDNLLGDYFGDVDFAQDTVPTGRWDYVLLMPAGRPVYYNELPGASHEVEDRPDGSKLYRWSMRDVPKIVPEPEMPGWSDVALYLHVSTYRDWESVARFWWGLVRDQIQPTPAIVRAANEAVAGIDPKDEAARVRAVYDYVVKNTRYVGLELGIHSFKPYKVEQVLRRRFGDCKDKASLAWSMLRALGIDSKLVLLRMRHLGSIGESPASLAVFNHAILYVPSQDLWLDGTAEWSGSRELPEVDRGAEVLVVDPEGESRFGKIPEAPAELSTTRTKQRIRLAPDGSATLEGESGVSGLPAPGYRRAYASPAGREALFEQAWARSFPGVKVESLEFSDLDALEEDVGMRFSLSVPRYAEREAGGLAFAPHAGGGYAQRYAAFSSRRHELVLRHAWVNEWRHEYELPEGWSFARIPDDATIESRFGEASLRYEIRDGRLEVLSRIRLGVPRVAPEDYPAFRDFLGRVDRALSRRIHVKPADAS